MNCGAELAGCTMGGDDRSGGQRALKVQQTRGNKKADRVTHGTVQGAYVLEYLPALISVRYLSIVPMGCCASCTF